MKTRKNKKMLVAVAMVLMIALVAGMGAMTYSKYITTSSAPSQTATAAKWNYVVSANATNLFGTEYKEGTDANTLATTNEEGTVVVKASSTANIVAPGTSGSMTITVDGESEVLAQFKMTMTCTEIKCADYAPIKWTLKKGDETLVEDATLAAFSTKLNEQTVKATWDETAKAYKFATAYTISWEWALTDPIDDATQTTCMYDTLIGYKAAGADWNDDAGIKVSTLVGATGKTFAEFAAENGVTYEGTSNIVTTMTIDFSATIEQVQA